MADERETNVDKLKVTELKTELRRRGLSDDGNKETLVKRLKEALKMEAGDFIEEPGKTDKSRIDVDDDEMEPVQIIQEAHQYIPVQTTQETVPSLNMSQIIICMRQAIEESVNNKLENIESIQESIKSEIKALTETFEKKYEVHQNKLENMERRMERVETELDNIGENFNRKLEIWEIQMSEQNKEFKEDVQKLEKARIGDNIKINARISDVHEEVKKGMQLNLDIAERENRKTERQLRMEIERKLGSGNLSKNEEVIENLKKQFDEKLTNVNKEISNLSNIQTANNMSFPFSSYLGGKNDEGAKFCGDYRKIHPMNFIKTIKNRGQHITKTQDLREFLRSNLTGNALIWWNCKEGVVNTMQDFEILFMKNFWSDLQQDRVREKLYFGRFDVKKNNLTTYALRLFAQAQYLTPSIPEGEMVMFISRHFQPEIKETIAIQNICSFDQLISYLSRVERNFDTQIMGNTLNNTNENRNNDMTQNRNNMRYYNELINGRNQMRSNVNNSNNVNNYQGQNQDGNQWRNYFNNSNRVNRNNFNRGNYDTNNYTRNQNNFLRRDGNNRGRQNNENVENSRNSNNGRDNVFDSRQVNVVNTTTTSRRSGSVDRHESRQPRYTDVENNDSSRPRSSGDTGRGDRTLSPHFH